MSNPQPQLLPPQPLMEYTLSPGPIDFSSPYLDACDELQPPSSNKRRCFGLGSVRKTPSVFVPEYVEFIPGVQGDSTASPVLLMSKQNTTSPLSMLYAMPPLFDGNPATNQQHQLKQQIGAGLLQDGLAAPSETAYAPDVAPKTDAAQPPMRPQETILGYPEPSSGSDTVSLWHGLDGMLQPPPPPPPESWDSAPPPPTLPASLPLACSGGPLMMGGPSQGLSQGATYPSQGHIEGNVTPLGGPTQDGTPPEQQLGPSHLGDVSGMLPIHRPIIPPPPNAPEIEGGVQPEFWSTTHDDIDDSYSWRKYGCKYVGSSNYKRDYYRCTIPGCEAKRYCERMDNNTVMVWYPGEAHNHSPPGSEVKVAKRSATGGVGPVKRPKRTTKGTSRSQSRKSGKRASLEDVFSPPMPAPYLHLGLPSTPGSDTRLESFMGQEVVPAHIFQSAAYDMSQLIKASVDPTHSGAPPMSPDLHILGLTPGLQGSTGPLHGEAPDFVSPTRRGGFSALSPLFRPRF